MLEVANRMCLLGHNHVARPRLSLGFPFFSARFFNLFAARPLRHCGGAASSLPWMPATQGQFCVL